MSEISFFIPSLEGIAFPNTTAGRRDFKAFLDIYGYVRDMHAQFMDSNGTRFGEEFRLEKMLYGEKTANSIIVDAERNSTILKIFVWVKPDKTKKKGNYMFIDVSTENGRLLLKKFCSIIDNNFTIRLRMTDNKSEYVGGRNTSYPLESVVNGSAIPKTDVDKYGNRCYENVTAEIRF